MQNTVKYKRTDKIGEGVIASTIDYRTLPVLDLSFIIKFKIDDDELDNVALKSLNDNLEKFIQDNIYSFKVAGGTIKSFVGIKARKDIKYFDDYIAVLSAHSYVLENNTEDIRSWLDDKNYERNIIQLFNNKTIDRLEGKYFLLQIGYKLLEEPKQKHFSRNKYPHAFAEPILCPIRIRKIASYRKSPDKYKTFWSYSKLDNNTLIIDTL